MSDDWQAVTILFLPRQFEQFEALLDQLQGRAQLVGTAPLELGPEFNAALADYAATRNVRSVGTAVATLTRMAIDWMRMSNGDPDQPWVRIDSVLGADAVPAAVGRVIREAIDEAVRRDQINPDHPWQWLELAAAEYIASA